MKPYYEILYTDGTKLNVSGDINDIDFKEIQRIVGGYVSLLDGGKLIVNEDGRMLTMPINKTATEYYGLDTIVGTAIYLFNHTLK